MDTSNWKPNQGGSSGGGVDSSVEGVDWRTLLAPDTRQKLVIRIMENLKKHPKFTGQEKLHELKDIALRFEEKNFNAATSHGVQQINNQGQTPPIPVPSNHPQAGKQILPQSIHNNLSSSGVSPGSGIACSTSQSSSLQNISIGNNMGNGIPPSSFVSQRQIPGSQNTQQYLYQKQPHQIAKQKLQQNNSNNNTTLTQPLIQQQHQHQNLFQSTHFQPSQLQPTMLQPSSLSTVKQNQQPHLQQSGQPMSQHNQPLVLRQQRQPQQPRVFGQQNNLSNVQSIVQRNNFSAIHRQHLGPQISQKQLQSLGTQSGTSTMLNNQHSSHLLQSTQGQRSQMELQQQVIPQLQTQSAQTQHQLNMKQRHPTSYSQQRAMPEASSTSSDSTAQTRNPNSGDWQEEVYQKVKTMKEKYFQDLVELYRKFIGRLQQHDSLPRQPNGDQVEKLKKYKHLLECFMKFLELPKNKLSLNHKEKLGAYEREIFNLISSQKGKPGSTLQQQRMNSLHQSQQTQMQFTQMQPNENQMNSQMQSVNLQHNSLATLHHNSISNAQQTMMGMLQQPNSNMLPHQQLKPLQSRQMQHQLMHKQPLLHHHQFHPETKHSAMLNVNQVSQPHQINDGNEVKIKQETEMKSESLKLLKLDQQNMLSSVTKSSTPLQPANSPFVVSSPSTPSTSNLPGDVNKISLTVSLLANDGNICTPGVSASPLLAECTNLDVSHANDASVVSGKSTTIEQPLERLLKVVKSISPKSLSSSVRDIGSVVSMVDSIAGSAPGNGSRTAVGSFNDSFNLLKYFENSELESTATSTIKRPRVETKHPLLEEIREINQGLIDTVVDISQENADPYVASEVGKGIIVKCSYSAVALCPNLKLQYASVQMSPIQPLRLLVPANYPNSSPIPLDEVPVEVSKEYEDLSIKAKWRFSSCVRRLSEPMSLEMMARTWDVCARAVILECAQQSGGGTFTSKYGAWEDCLTAA
ncbi:hypothetical protein M8C21_011636 [Ambrosia artemisiifolia]|uniref:Mediator complex subunit 15 KIX domain-containing protein n=1 Tax=Ambrosia artemisiifolia TaxID=4212 RepID=A0AAD5D8J4_AMBAR|nr:hypothetical protein M8C21_011636 [Ambrosia artemisiifolia]